MCIRDRRRRFYSTAVSPPRAGSGPEGSRAEPLLRGAFMEKDRLLEPRSPSGQNARLRGGIEEETEGAILVSTRHGPRQFPLHPYSKLEHVEITHGGSPANK